MDTKKVVTFGEVMMRLSSPNYQKIEQVNSLEVSFGGSEMNVAASLRNFGLEAKHVSVFPKNRLGKKAIAYMRLLDLDTSGITLCGDRMGLYFFEKGASMRASQIIYDRKDSAFQNLDPTWFNWEEILKDAKWFHWSGITAALSQNAATACLEAVKVAHKMGITVSSDIYYRQDQWKYGKTPQEILPEIASYSTILLANELNMRDILGVQYADGDNSFIEASENTMELMPNIKKVVDTKRKQYSSHHNVISSKLFNGKKLIKSQKQDITFIVDRIGAGDAFLGGFIYGQIVLQNDQDSINFGTAASALKHTIEGDFNLASIEEIENLVSGDISGRIKR